MSRCSSSDGARVGQHACRREKRGKERRRVHQLDAVIPHHVGDGGDQRVRVLRSQARQHREQRQVRHDPREDLDVLDLTGHDCLRHPRRLQQGDALAQLPERHPVQVSPRLARGSSGQVGPGLFLHRNDGDVMPERARRLEHEEGKAAVAGDDTKPHGRVRMRDAPGLLRDPGAAPHLYSSATISSARRVARRRITPRCELRMNSTRYCTSGQLSVSSSSICRSARLVVNFDTSR